MEFFLFFILFFYLIEVNSIIQKQTEVFFISNK